MRWWRQLLVMVLLLFLVDVAAAQATPAGGPDRDFRQWLQRQVRPLALRHGIAPQVVDAVLARVRPVWSLPDLVLPGREEVPRRQRQAEFSVPARYFDERSLKAHVRTGRRLAHRHRRLLAHIERRFGVPGSIVLAIWARESNYGRAAIRHDAFSILATQAYAGRRRALFLKELLAAMRMVASGEVRMADMKSSWAGALGQPQFLPSDFLRHAVDFDGDGRRDIWRSVADVLASIASHLQAHGWRRGVHWGVEVQVPAAVPCHLEGPDQGRPAAWWWQQGVRPVDGGGLPRSWREVGEVFLLMPAGRHGPAFLVSGNFHVIKSYNMSDLYALFVGHLADRIAGRVAGPFRTRWGRVGHLLRSEVACMQRQLERLGHDVGGVDGLAGFRTRRAIGRHEQAMGLPARCFPTEETRRLLCGGG